MASLLVLFACSTLDANASTATFPAPLMPSCMLNSINFASPFPAQCSSATCVIARWQQNTHLLLHGSHCANLYHSRQISYRTELAFDHCIPTHQHIARRRAMLLRRGRKQRLQRWCQLCKASCEGSSPAWCLGANECGASIP